MKIVLYGFMAVGKSVVGKILAEKLQFGFIDTDEEIEKQVKIPIHTIFDKFGEQKFRALEHDIIRMVSSKEWVVVACGGGAVLDSRNVQMLKRDSIMVLLTAKPEIILERVDKDPSIRPLLSDLDRLSKIKCLMSSRLDKYLEPADIIIDTSNIAPEDVAREIFEKIRGEKLWIS